MEVHCVLGTQRLLDLGQNMSEASLQVKNDTIPSVQDNLEWLRRSTEFNLRKVLGIHKI
jgi:hypothetical protein